LIDYHGINIQVFYVTPRRHSLLIPRQLRSHIILEVKWRYHYEGRSSFILNIIRRRLFFLIMDVSSVLVNVIDTDFPGLLNNNFGVPTTLNLRWDLITWDSGASLEHGQVYSDSAGFCPSFKRIKFSALSYLNISPN